MRKPSIDQSAAATGAVLTILGVFDVAALLGISGDDLAMVVGALATLGGVIRHRFESRRGEPTTVADEPTAEILPAEDEVDA
jgi:uncharacterized membrane protein HdeD (DUF308 family)